MISHPYKLLFQSENDENEKFILTFNLCPARKVPLLFDVQVYQVRGDMFCKVTSHVASKRTILHVESLHNSMNFNIEIFADLQSCEVFVVEKVLRTIVHQTIKPTPTPSPAQ